jgi:hypothetical protein
MQLRRKATLIAPLLMVAGAIVMNLAAETASADKVVRSPFERDYLRSRVSKLRTSATGVDPDTVWIGHVTQVAGYGPHSIGRGPRLMVGGTPGGGPASKPASSFEGVWSFDHFRPGETDSLQGWWPLAMPFASVGPSDKDDCLRPWFALDYGNQGNYSIPQGAPKRTFGVTGYWHSDNGTLLSSSVAGTNPVAPGWSPIAGTRSAWCGLRSHGDLTAIDPTAQGGTGNPINDNLAQYQGNNSGRQIGPASTTGTDHNFPGYGSQWDQMLYRDVTVPSSQGLNISFSYSTDLSDVGNLGHSSQTGYYYYDPLKTVLSCADGNFISATGGTGPPADSFMVYVGKPVEPVAGPPIPPGDGNDFFGSDNVAHEIYDPQRRWFSEVVDIANYVQLRSVHGVNAAASSGVIALSATQVNTIVGTYPGKVRLVFRVKTNRGSDDEAGGFSSNGRGAAIVDAVSVSGTTSGSLLSDGFEGVNGGIDNSPGTLASAAWKSTGKPPQPWFHVHNIQGTSPYPTPAPFLDPCGAVTSAVRLCNMGGNVLSPGWHDNPAGADKTGGPFGGNFQDMQKMVVSPTINLMSTGSGAYNGMGIDTEIASRKGLFLESDLLWNVYDYDISTGNGWRIGWQSYPATQANGVKTWGEMRKDITFNATGGIVGCFNTFHSSAYDEQLIFTTNTSGVPDSVRVYIESMSRCYTLPLTQNTCSPASGQKAGGYFDNLSIGFFAQQPAQLAVNFGTTLQDCFPVNSTNKNVTAFGLAYDTLAANLRTGNNIAPNASNDITGEEAREAIQGDTIEVVASGNNVRMDMIFRIMPGVGNYVTVGSKASGIARRPDLVPRDPATSADPANAGLPAVAKFWGSYMGNTGPFGTGGNGTVGVGHDPDGGGPIVAGTQWDPNAWNSARMDTLEQNFFPCNGIAPNISTNPSGALVIGSYMGAYHEEDPRYAVLGIAKNRCFLEKNKQPIKADEGGINCMVDASVAHPVYPPAWVTANPALSGYNANEIAGQPGKTYEYTKIIPDGQLTPGAMVQYFFRKSTIGAPINQFSLNPDTNFVIPNDAPFASFDGHRWMEASVLPDRWKNQPFGGEGMACMLVVDRGDRRGDEFVWVSVADSIGLTTAAKRGAHNGWRARPDQDVTVNVGGDNSISRRDNGGQAGTAWDFFETVAGESNFPGGRLGSRLANRNGNAASFTRNKWSTAGPSEDMLKNYKTLLLLNSDLGENQLGPVPNQTDDELTLLQNFLTIAGGVQTTPRALMLMGYDVGDAFRDATLQHGTAHAAFMASHFRATWRSGDYRQFAANSNDITNVTIPTPVAASTFTHQFGNQCFVDNDVFNFETPAPSGQPGATYDPSSSPPNPAPFVGGVYAADAVGHPSRTLINGWTLGLFGGGFGTKCTGCGVGGADLLLNLGVRKYFTELLSNAFSFLTCQPSLTPVGVGDNPGGGTGGDFVNFMKLRTSNPMHSGEARLAFGLAKTEKVELRVYDVTGRTVKTVANRIFASGKEHVLIWDGTDEAGNKVKAGVYFYQLKTPTWTSQKKLAVLSN